MTNNAIIGLGSNIAPEKNIPKAREFLARRYHVLAESAFIKTSPIGLTAQPDFINGAVSLETELNFKELTAALKNLEVELGRISSPVKFGPRSIDLDIVVFNNEIVDQDFYEREYLKQSILELVPALKY